MTALVLDCSMAVAWCFEDEATPATDTILVRVRNEGAVVPALWHLEINNVLLTSERRLRLTQERATRMLAVLAALPIGVDETTPGRVTRDIVPLARQHRLTVHDAAYLELAIRAGRELAGRDTALLAAAAATGVAMLTG
jgi:predicted nucleic acid-binding protein